MSNTNSSSVRKAAFPSKWLGVDGAYKITPDMAAELLELNAVNRKISEVRVRDYARQMREGLWRDNGQGIIFDKGLRLMNGQHRLRACVEADVPFVSRIAWGVDEDAFDTIDVGRVRSAGDVFLIAGEAYTWQLAATLRLLYRHERGLLIAKTSAQPNELRDVLEKHGGVREAVARCAGDKYLGRVVYPSASAFLYYLVSGHFKEEVEAFYQQLAHGIDLGPASPARMFREKMFGQSNAMRLNQLGVLALLVKCWNAQVSGRPVRSLRWIGGEAFPEITTKRAK